MIDRVLRAAAVGVVVALAIPPAIELAVIGNGNPRAFAATILVLAAALGVLAAIRRRPLGARLTTAAYGALEIGLGLFATGRPVWQLIGYVVGLVGMNLLLYDVQAYGPALAAVREEDEVSRRMRGVVLRSLAISGGALALAFGGSLALLPAFALDVGSRDPIVAFALAGLLVSVLFVLALLPQLPRFFRGPRRSDFR